MKKKILHLCSADKFISQFVEFNSENFSDCEHTYWIFGSYPGLENKEFKRVARHNSNKCQQCVFFWELICDLHSHEAVICHGLFGRKLIILLYLLPWTCKKLAWAVWGGDLYSVNKKSETFFDKLLHYIKAKTIRRISYYLTYLDGDVEKIKEIFDGHSKWLKCFLYRSNILQDHTDPQTKTSHKSQKDHILRIQLGNSADPSNLHIPIIKKLSDSFDCEYELHVPLAYGNPKYRAEILLLGEELLGPKFRPQTTFVDYHLYLKSLRKIDIAIFNFDRQQGMGNIINLINYGAHVYLKAEQSPYKYLRSIGITVGAISSDFSSQNLRKLTDCEKLKNKKIIQELHSENQLVEQWRNIYETIGEKNVESSI